MCQPYIESANILSEYEEMIVFYGHQKLISAMKQRPEK